VLAQRPPIVSNSSAVPACLLCRRTRTRLAQPSVTARVIVSPRFPLQGFGELVSLRVFDIQRHPANTPRGVSQSNYYYERVVISMCPSLANRSSYPSNSVLT
jgi:hypothetical protein